MLKMNLPKTYTSFQSDAYPEGSRSTTSSNRAPHLLRQMRGFLFSILCVSSYVGPIVVRDNMIWITDSRKRVSTINQSEIEHTIVQPFLDDKQEPMSR